MTKEEWNALVKAFQRPPYNTYRGWIFDYEHPGLFMYYNESLSYDVFFTPEYLDLHEIAIQVDKINGETLETVSWPFFSNTPEDLFAIVRQWLDFVEWNIAGRPKSVKDWVPGKGRPWIPWSQAKIDR